jgi:carboxymethylenebutenolidase
MIEEEWSVPTTGSPLRTFCARPERDGPYPLVLISPDGPGYRDLLKELTRRFATSGYCAVLTDWLSRFGGPMEINLAAPTKESIEELYRRITAALSSPETSIVPDARAVVDFVAAKKIADTSKVGAVGYCWGGAVMVELLAGLPDKIVAAAGFHPMWLDENDKFYPDLSTVSGGPPEQPVPPRLLKALDRIKGELYLGCAEEDNRITVASYRALGDAMKARGVAGEVEIYPGVKHGFAINGISYHQPSEARHFERTLSLWRRRLG